MQAVGDKRAADAERALGEVDDPRDPVDEEQTQRHQRVGRADGDAAGQDLQELDHGRLPDVY